MPVAEVTYFHNILIDVIKALMVYPLSNAGKYTKCSDPNTHVLITALCRQQPCAPWQYRRLHEPRCLHLDVYLLTITRMRRVAGGSSSRRGESPVLHMVC